MKIIAIVLAVVGLFAVSAAIISLFPQATAQPLPAVGDQYLEFRATQDATADFYPAAAALTLRGSEVCFAK